jgi:hypothetical protein
MFNRYNTLRFSQMAQTEKDVVQAGVEAWYHYCYEVKNKEGKYDKYRSYAMDGTSLKEKQELFTKGLQREAMRYANLPTGSTFAEHIIASHPSAKWATFQLIGQTLDIIVPETILDNFYQFAEVKNVAWGDNLVFHVDSPDTFVVSKIANGIRRGGNRQRLFSEDIVLNPVRNEVAIYEEFYRVVSGKTEWGSWVARVAQSIETQITLDIYNAIYGSFSSLGASYKENAAFAQLAFNNLVTRVSAANGGARTVAFGTKVALSKIVPDDQYFRFALGQEYNGMGHLGNFQGTELFMFDQRLLPNTDNFGIADDFILVVSTPADKLVKVGFEGETEVYQNDQNKNADRSVEYAVAKHWDVKIATSARFGIYKLA